MASVTTVSDQRIKKRSKYLPPDVVQVVPKIHMAVQQNIRDFVNQHGFHPEIKRSLTCVPQHHDDETTRDALVFKISGNEVDGFGADIHIQQSDRYNWGIIYNMPLDLIRDFCIRVINTIDKLSMDYEAFKLKCKNINWMSIKLECFPYELAECNLADRPESREFVLRTRLCDVIKKGLTNRLTAAGAAMIEPEKLGEFVDDNGKLKIDGYFIDVEHNQYAKNAYYGTVDKYQRDSLVISFGLRDQATAIKYIDVIYAYLDELAQTGEYGFTRSVTAAWIPDGPENIESLLKEFRAVQKQGDQI